MDIEELIENFELLGQWEDRYRYIIELGRKIPEFNPDNRVEEYLVRGCQSQVWLVCEKQDALLHFKADSDAHIVRGLLSIILMMYSDKTPEQIQSVDAKAVFTELGLDQHLSPSRANGLNSMVGRIQAYAQTHAS